MAALPATRGARRGRSGARGWAMHLHRTAVLREFSVAAQTRWAELVLNWTATARRQFREWSGLLETGTCSRRIRAACRWLDATGPWDTRRRDSSRRPWDRNK